MANDSRMSASICLLLAVGCSSMPSGPSVMALPGTGRDFDQFRSDDINCQQYASAQMGGTSPNQAAIDSGVSSAVIGSALGAAAGAAINGGDGALVGAGLGLVAGGLVGSSVANSSMQASQAHYDSAYIQCMYAQGHQVPVSGQFSNGLPRQPSNPATSVSIPPPPPGLPPPPPLR